MAHALQTICPLPFCRVEEQRRLSQPHHTASLIPAGINPERPGKPSGALDARRMSGASSHTVYATNAQGGAHGAALRGGGDSNGSVGRAMEGSQLMKRERVVGPDQLPRCSRLRLAAYKAQTAVQVRPLFFQIVYAYRACVCGGCS